MHPEDFATKIAFARTPMEVPSEKLLTDSQIRRALREVKPTGKLVEQRNAEFHFAQLREKIASVHRADANRARAQAIKDELNREMMEHLERELAEDLARNAIRKSKWYFRLIDWARGIRY